MARLLSVSGSASVSIFCLAALCLSACKNQPPPAAEATAAEPAPPPPVATAAAAAAPASAEPAAAVAPGAAPAASKYSEAPFDVVIQPKGAYTAGQAGAVELVVSAKPPFHANDKYPYKFKLLEAPGVKYPNLVVDKEVKDAVKVEKMRATVSVALTPESAGKHTVSGKLFFSVCNDDQCLVEKRDLALEIDSK